MVYDGRRLYFGCAEWQMTDKPLSGIFGQVMVDT